MQETEVEEQLSRDRGELLRCATGHRATGLVSPVVLHTRSSYVATTVDGVVGWRQLYPLPRAGDADSAAQPFLARLAA